MKYISCIDWQGLVDATGYSSEKEILQILVLEKLFSEKSLFYKQKLSFNEDIMSKELEKEGWIKRNTIDDPRLSEIIEEYESLGFEPMKLEDLDKECRICYKNQLDKLKTVYTRKKQ